MTVEHGLLMFAYNSAALMVGVAIVYIVLRNIK